MMKDLYKTKLVVDKLMYQPVTNPPMHIAVMNNDFTKEYHHHFVNTHNAGIDLLDIYIRYRDNMRIDNVLEMLKNMEEVFKDYDYHSFEIERGRNRE